MARMEVAAHPRFGQIRKSLRAAPELFQPWKGAAYRATTLEYAKPENILLGRGSFFYGGRWNAIGSFHAVYGSTEDTVAVVESRATADYAHLPLPFRTPRLLVAIELSLQRVIDLTSVEVRQALGLTLEEFQLEDWRKMQDEGRESLTQAIGRAVFAQGGEGLLAPSARIPAGVNIAFFPQNQDAASRVKVLEAEKLERVRLL